MMVVMWQVHVTRATSWVHRHRYPILEQEVLDLVESASDLVRDPLPDGSLRFRWEAEDHFGFTYWNDEISAMKPTEPMVRRMLAMAGVLDAWVEGEDPAHYFLDPTGSLVQRQPPLQMIYENLEHLITRGSVALPAEEWQQIVDQEPDFRMSDDVEARLPSGRRRISSPRHAEWLGHPSGRLRSDTHRPARLPARRTARRIVQH